jgi:GPN-loop GTPase
MAGSGKTTLIAQLQRSLEQQQMNNSASLDPIVGQDDASLPTEVSVKNGDDVNRDDQARETKSCTETIVLPNYYCMNLDPATIHLPYEVAIDIRDTVDYAQVMRQHKLGPNGAIMTSLNLFATKFDQVMRILEQRAYPGDTATATSHLPASNTDSPSSPSPENSLPPQFIEYFLVDTPGQIEAFTWSASGTIITESLASAFPVVLCFVVDTVRCASSPNTFMSNMLYACSMYYRSRLPIVICFNKTDVVSHTFCVEWMQDYEAFQQALDNVASTTSSNDVDASGGGGAGFYSSLTRSLSLVLDEFYTSFTHSVGVSAVTGAGMDDFWRTVSKAASEDFVTDYVQDLHDRVEEQHVRKLAKARSQVRRLHRDVENNQGM